MGQQVEGVVSPGGSGQIPGGQSTVLLAAQRLWLGCATDGSWGNYGDWAKLGHWHQTSLGLKNKSAPC